MNSKGMDYYLEERKKENRTNIYVYNKKERKRMSYYL